MDPIRATPAQHRAQLRHQHFAPAEPVRASVPLRVGRMSSGKYSFIDLTIREGRNRQVRRMLEAVGSKVLKLVRTAIGPLRIEDLEIGKYRKLTAAEVKRLAM